MKKDSNLYMKHRNPYMEAYPEAPVPPPVPPADINAPDSPDIENLVQPEPVAPSELTE